jgi:hypothetical protein
VRRRALAGGLIAYGLLGLALVALALPISLDFAGRVERLAASADGTLRAAGTSASAAAEALEGLDQGLGRSAASSGAAARLARDSGATLDSLATAMQLSIFGAQPLLPLADDFATSADQAIELGDQLDGITESLATSQQDLGSLRAEIDALALEIVELRGATAEQPAGAPPLTAAGIVLLAWLAVPALASLGAGLWLFRR